MKIVHATWEKRNLGVDCYEIIVEESDAVSEVSETIDAYTTEYTVVKIPVGHPEIGFMLEDKGFHFIEAITLWRYQTARREAFIPGIIARALQYIEFIEADDDGVRLVEGYIRAGLFDTGRVYLDPDFINEQAANRFICWMRDEREKGMPVWLMTFKDRPIGYIQLSVDKDGVLHTTHEGVFPDSGIPYAGMLLRYGTIKLTNRLNAKKAALSGISSNNPKSLRPSIHLGDELVDLQYVYVKHGTLTSGE